MLATPKWVEAGCKINFDALFWNLAGQRASKILMACGLTKHFIWVQDYRALVVKCFSLARLSEIFERIVSIVFVSIFLVGPG